MTARRAPQNPILTPDSIRPSRPDLAVVGVFNPAVTLCEGEVILLVRVAEAPAERVESEVVAPVFNTASAQIEFKRWRKDSAGLDVSDPRVIVVNGRSWLTSISHLRVARSRDGIRFEVDSKPALSPATDLEAFGVEDARITMIGDRYWINYSAVSSRGIATGLASTRDFRSFERHGIIFPPNNRDVTIFPEKIAGRYVALHRPMPEGIGEPAIWCASSSDMKDWGDHRFVAAARPGLWDDAKIGGGAVPFRVDGGWVAVYHGVRKSRTEYALGALLLDAHDPSVVLARSRAPILEPKAPYERHGFFDGVVFTCGLLRDDDLVRVYYGAADGVTALADLSLAEILGGLA